MKAIALRTDQRQTVYFEVDEYLTVIEAAPTETAAAGAKDVVKNLDKMSDTVVQVCKEIFSGVTKGLGDLRPSEFEIEFGVTLAGEAGVPLVAKGTAEAALKITAKWIQAGAAGGN